MHFSQSKSTKCEILPEIMIFFRYRLSQRLKTCGIGFDMLIVEIYNKCHWIQHALNPKYTPLKQFPCIFPSQNQQNVKFVPEIVIFQEPLLAETRILQHWIQHVLNPKYASLKLFQCIFPSQNQQNVKFRLFP